MVGALSIIRFRSAIKDPIDVVFMFWAVSVGIANGVANFKVAITTTIVPNSTNMTWFVYFWLNLIGF